MSFSIFTSPLSVIDIDFIRRFCDQGMPEGHRLDYKKEFIDNRKLAKIISAFANTNGGIILIGVLADKKTNKPVDIPGIELKDGLEERIVNICYSNISPALIPEVKVCPFKSDQDKEENDKAVMVIRVNQSYNAPHYLLHSNEIPIRLHNKNDLADLRTVEDLIGRREQVKASSTSSSFVVQYDKKLVTSNDDIYFTIIIAPNFAMKPVMPFNKENIDQLVNAMNDLMRTVDDQKYMLWGFDFTHVSTTGQITRVCRMRESGSILFQKGVGISAKGKDFDLYQIIQFLIVALKMAHQIYTNFGFFGELSVGLTVVNTGDLYISHDTIPRLRYLRSFSGQRFLQHKCLRDDVHVNEIIRYDELSQLEKIIEFFIAEILKNFGLFLPSKEIEEDAKKLVHIFSTDR